VAQGVGFKPRITANRRSLNKRSAASASLTEPFVPEEGGQTQADFSNSWRTPPRPSMRKWPQILARISFALASSPPQNSSDFGRRVGRERLARAHCGPFVPQRTKYFENLAAGRKHSSARSFVPFHRVHEFPFFGRIITLARRGINLPTSHGLTATGRSPIVGRRCLDRQGSFIF